MKEKIYILKESAKQFSGDNPVTWGQYWKLCGGIMGIYAIVGLVWFIGYKVSEMRTQWQYQKDRRKDTLEL